MPSTAACTAKALLWPVAKITSSASSNVPTPIVKAYFSTWLHRY